MKLSIRNKTSILAPFRGIRASCPTTICRSIFVADLLTVVTIEMVKNQVPSLVTWTKNFKTLFPVKECAVNCGQILTHNVRD